MNASAKLKLISRNNSDLVDRVETRFDSEYGVYWAYMCPNSRALCLTVQLLDDLRNYIDSIIEGKGEIFHMGRKCRINYAVLASKVPTVFNLGGDLGLLRKAIASGDRQLLVKYGEKCIDDLYPWNRSFDLPITTIALVQGAALGGGFEAALASSVIIAEESAKMGFPEVLFNLFPGMGAYSFLQRKVGRRVTEEMLLSGNIYPARQLYDMGVVDAITPDGTGEAAVQTFIRKHSHGNNGRRAFERVRRDFESVTRAELLHIMSVWVDAAMCLADGDLKMMDRLIRAQKRAGEVVTELQSTFDRAPAVNGEVLSIPATTHVVHRRSRSDFDSVKIDERDMKGLLASFAELTRGDCVSDGEFDGIDWQSQLPGARDVRVGLGLSQRELAALSNIPIGTIRNWDQGRRAPDVAAQILLSLIGQNPQLLAGEINRLRAALIKKAAASKNDEAER